MTRLSNLYTTSKGVLFIFKIFKNYKACLNWIVNKLSEASEGYLFVTPIQVSFYKYKKMEKKMYKNEGD